MPIYAKDRERLQPGADSLAALILGNHTKQKQASQASELSMAEAGNNARIRSQAIDENQARGQQFADSQDLQPGKYSISASESGMNINPESEAATNLARSSALDARNDRDLVHLGERVEKSDIPNQMSALANLERGTASPDGKGGIVTNKDYEVKSAGPIANALPQPVKNFGEMLGMMPEGASEEAALIQRLTNADIKRLSGSAVSTYEMGRQNVEKGTSIGGDSNLVKLGIKQMQDALESGARNIESSTRPEIVKTFKDQGGRTTLQEFLGSPQAPQGSGGMDPAKKARLEQLRAKHKGSN